MLGLMQDWPLTIGSVIAHAGRWHGAGEIVSRTLDGSIHRYTYGDAERRARRLAKALGRLGIRPGERVGALAWNHYRHLELFYGVSGAGVVLHTANPRLFADQLAYTIDDAGDRLLFVDTGHLELAESLADRLPAVEFYVVLCAADEMPPSRLANLLCYEELLAAADDDYAWGRLDERTAATLCYTSGTTGRPKGVLTSHRGCVLQALSVMSPDAYGIANADVVLPSRAADPASLHALIEAERVTLGLAVPTVWLGLLDHLAATGGRLESLERIGCGGSAPPPAMIETLAREHGVATVHAFGMTETTAACTYARPAPELDRAAAAAILASQGRPAFGTEIRVVDDRGLELPRDGAAVGNLMARGHWVASGYYGERAGAALDADGWLATGDVGTIDGAGYMRITDRAKDVIKSGGEWISSIALENLAVGHPAVAEAAVIAIPHPKWQERPLLVVVASAGASIDQAALLAWLAPHVAKWWLPDAVVVVDHLPHTATGKIKKTDLRARFIGDSI